MLKFISILNGQIEFNLDFFRLVSIVEYKSIVKQQLVLAFVPIMPKYLFTLFYVSVRINYQTISKSRLIVENNIDIFLFIMINEIDDRCTVLSFDWITKLSALEPKIYFQEILFTKFFTKRWDHLYNLMIVTQKILFLFNHTLLEHCSV